MADLQSRPYKPNPQQCCERCAFGSGKHAEFCESLVAEAGRALRRAADLAKIISRAYDAEFSGNVRPTIHLKA